MQIFIISEILAIFILTAYLLHRYAAKSVSFGIRVAVFIPWFLCFLTIGLVPIDVYYSSMGNADPTNTDPESPTAILQVTWRIVYWASFFLSWIGLPLLQEYVDAGDFTRRERIKRSLIVNLITYLVMGLFGLLFILYLVLSQKMGKEGIVQFFITFANCFGIFLIILCLGFGLVHIPKRYLQKTKKSVNLKYYQFHLAEVDEERNSLKVEIEDMIKLVHLLSLRKDVDPLHKTLLNKVLMRCPEEMVAEAKHTICLSDHTSANEYGDITHAKIVSLNKDLKKKMNEIGRLEHKYETTLNGALRAEDVLESKTAEEWAMRTNPDNEMIGSCAKFFNKLQWAWYTKIEQICFIIMGLFFSVCSICVFCCEILTFDAINLFSIQTVIGESFTRSQIICLIPLFYISICVYSSLFSMKLSGIYGLYSHQQTDAGSLVFASLNFSRVSSPLVFNFLQMNKINGTSFNTVMGDVSLAYSFTQYFPLILILLVLSQLFDVYGRIMTWLGLSRFKFSENFDDEKIEEGRALLAKLRKRRNSSSQETKKPRKTSSEAPTLSLKTKLLINSSDSSDVEDGRDRLRTMADSPDRLFKRTSTWNGYKSPY